VEIAEVPHRASIPLRIFSVVFDLWGRTKGSFCAAKARRFG